MAITGFQRGEPAAATAPVVELDASQRAVVELPDSASAAVLGAPGTGKTTTLIELVADRVLERGWGTDEVLALTTSRASATRLRDAIAMRLGVPTAGPMARTVNSFAFALVSASARAEGRPVPRLVTGAEQDTDIAAFLEGHLEEGTGPRWPDSLGDDVRRTRRFRTELRELMMRATEFDVAPAGLRQLGIDTRHPEWIAAADFMAEYLQILSVSREQQVDTAELARFAVSAIGSADADDLVGRLRLVIVDDFQDVTESTIAILAALAARGAAVIAFGDPDVAVASFRGGEADSLGRFSELLGLRPAAELRLDSVHRHGAELRSFTAAVTSRIGAAAAGRQRAAAASLEDPAEASIARIEATTPARQWAAIARELRERHLMHGVPWSDMAVVVRSRTHVALLGRALAQAEVPVYVSSAGMALRDDPAARALLAVVDIGSRRTELTPEAATELLLGPFGGLDRLGLRRLRLALRAEELAGGGVRQADQLLAEALITPGGFATIDHRVGRLAQKLADTIAVLRASDGGIEELLWIAWDRGGLARTWREHALGSGPVAEEANRNLDGVVALFTAAKRFAERRPNDAATTFLEQVLESEVPEDLLSPRAAEDVVLVTTPAGTVGLEFDTVVVAALQEGVWPDMRLRGSLLAPQELVRVIRRIDSSTIDERKVVRDDELRMFALAISRARARLVLAAVANDEEAVSPFVALAPANAPTIDSTRLSPLSLRGMTGRLRRALYDQGSAASVRAAAAANLARLATLEVPGASPDDWHGLLELSSSRALFDDEPAPVSPSKLDDIETSALDWFLESVSRADSGIHANIGTIMHAVLESATGADVEGLWQTVESRWGELTFDAPWIEQRQKRLVRGYTQALAEYLADFQATGHRVVAAEERFELEVGRAVVRGSIDRVELAGDGAVVIVDLKTSSPIRASDVPGHPQLAVYQLAYAQGRLDELLVQFGDHRSGGAKLLFIKKGTKAKRYVEAIQQPFGAEELEAFTDRIKAAAKLIASAEFRGVADLTKPFDSTAALRLHRIPAVSSD